MKRNKRTVILAHAELSPLTERILAAMGREGLRIRRRLKDFYRERALDRETAAYEPLPEPPGWETPSL